MKTYKSITNSMRHVCLINKKILRNENKLPNLFTNKSIKNYAGRNNSGKITIRSKGHKHKRFYRLIDYKRLNHNIPGIVYSNEYDPNRSSFISLIVFKNFLCCYIIGINNLRIGNTICSYNRIINNYLCYKKGDSNRLIYFTIGSVVHNVELLPEHGGIYIRSAGTYGKIIKKNSKLNKILIELPSKVQFYTSLYSYATLGTVSNTYNHNIVIGKAGRNRWLGKKSSVRGVAMNPVDHPHGGGEGKKSNSAFKRSPWGKIYKWNNKNRIFK